LDPKHPKSISNLATTGGHELADRYGRKETGEKYVKKAETRSKGVQHAVKKLTNEEERHMTPDEMSKREKIVKSMKPVSDWENRYPGRGKEVMYATATKQAMKEDVEQIDETWKSLKKTKANLDDIRKTGKKVIVRHGEGDTIYRVLKQKKNVKEDVEQIDEIKVGDKVHLGLKQKGGAGMKGTVHKIGDSEVHVNVGKEKFGDRIVKGSMKNVTKEEKEVSRAAKIKEIVKNKARAMKETEGGKTMTGQTKDQVEMNPVHKDGIMSGAQVKSGS